MTRHTLQKLFRYSVLFPLDLLRALPAFLAAIVLWPARFFIDNVQSARLTARVVLVLFLWRRPQSEIIDSLADTIKRAKIGVFRSVMGFFQWPYSLERRALGIHTVDAHHRARLLLVQKELPPASIILDLGGSSGGIPEGGLLNMGYPHSPSSVTLVDLPPDAQFWKHDAPTVACYQHGASRVHYHYSGMADLSAFADDSIDGVWGGQCIEHVPHSVALETMTEVLRVLKPGAWFCLDTPNRHMTRRLVRVGLIHPEHFHEYLPEELSQHLKATGFQVERTLGVSSLTLSQQLGKFWKYEVEYGAPLSTDAASGFSFLIEARKPSLPTNA
jgi:SAM-dependent methyltransferase